MEHFAQLLNLETMFTFEKVEPEDLAEDEFITTAEVTEVDKQLIDSSGQDSLRDAEGSSGCSGAIMVDMDHWDNTCKEADHSDPR